ncbi:MAG: DUF4368 domain-containing protein [Clostridia bacterium]|nr:DUF4368 domain-containing protein [Clostridia bacterium]
MEQVVVNDIQRYARLAQEDMSSIVEKLNSRNSKQEETHMQPLSTVLKRTQDRYQELDRIMKHLYEDSVAGRITNNRFQKLSAEFEAEQIELGKQIENKKNKLETNWQTKMDFFTWLNIIKNYADIQKLDRNVISELIDKITVSESKIVGGEKHVDVTIYYRFIGMIH